MFSATTERGKPAALPLHYPALPCTTPWLRRHSPLVRRHSLLAPQHSPLVRRHSPLAPQHSPPWSAVTPPWLCSTTAFTQLSHSFHPAFTQLSPSFRPAFTQFSADPPSLCRGGSGSLPRGPELDGSCWLVLARTGSCWLVLARTGLACREAEVARKLPALPLALPTLPPCSATLLWSTRLSCPSCFCCLLLRNGQAGWKTPFWPRESPAPGISLLTFVLKLKVKREIP